jgi:hypothetical protein
MTYNVLLFSDIYRPLHGKGMGVYRLANHIRDSGYTVKVIHGFVKLSDREFKDICEKYISSKTVMVGLGATVLANLEQSKFFGIDDIQTRKRFESLKEQFPNIKLCLGGAQVTGATDVFLQRFNYFDYAVKGQGENVVVAILNHLTTGSKLVSTTVTLPRIVSDKTYPFEDFNLSLNIFRPEDAIQHGEGLPIELARGCIFKCKFCGYDLIGKKLGDYTKRSSNIREELLRNYHEWGTTNYYVADETINDSEEKIDLLLEAVSNLPFRPTFGGFLRLDLIWKFPSMANKLKDLGMEACSFGIETINDASGKAVGKGLGRRRIEETLSHLRSVWKDDVFVNASFILGLKHDNPNTAQELDEWIAQQYRLKTLHTVFVKPLYIMPSTGLSFLDSHYQEQGYEIMSADQTKLVSDRTRTVVPEDYLVWKTSTYNFVDATYDADIIHKKYNDIKICKGKIGKHNYAFVKSILPVPYKEQLMNVVINNVPFNGMTVQETESYIINLDKQYYQQYLNKL